MSNSQENKTSLLLFKLEEIEEIKRIRIQDFEKKTFLVGCYKNNEKKQLKWIYGNETGRNRYNVRLNKGRDGWVNLQNPKVLKPDFILLYNIDDTYSELLCFQYQKHEVLNEEQMRKSGYTSPNGEYLVYHMRKTELIDQININTILSFYKDRNFKKGQPIYLTGKEILKILSSNNKTKTKNNNIYLNMFDNQNNGSSTPTISEICNNIKKDIEFPVDCLTSMDLFSGCGGLTKGFEMAGIKSIFASDIDENCAKTFKRNFPRTPFLCKDITLITKEEVDKITGGVIPDIIIGGPPCQGFSLANKRRNKISDDPRNRLFYGFVKFIDWYSPKAFVMENVKGLLSMQDGEVLETIISSFTNAGNYGYNIEYKVMLASDYGVPQNRERVILIGIRKDLNITPIHPEPTSCTKVTVDEAISDLPRINAGEGSEVQAYPTEPQNDYQRLMRNNSSYVTNHIAMKHTKRLIDRFEAIKPGQSLIDVWETHGAVKRGAPGEKSNIKFSQNNQRLFGNLPAPTIAASFQSNFIHPHLNRNFTAREGARLQSFPDDFIFEGMRTKMSWEKGLSQYQQIGNAVPVLMAKAIGDCLVKLMK